MLPKVDTVDPLASLIVRKARLDDADAITLFSAAMALETEGRTLDQGRLRRGTLALLSASSHGFFMVAELTREASPQLVGQLMITYEWSDWRDGVFWWMQSVYVDPAWRRRGIFRRMHDAIMGIAKADPTVCGVRLYVEGENDIAKYVYSRVGMTRSTYQVFESDFILSRGTVGGE
jgi:ribosomal protein S18 acetylase RimI-like enzyme